MAGWDSVPWFVDGGALHSAEVCRLLPYLTTRGNEGVLGSADCKITQLGTPGAGVQIAPGVATILSRATAMSDQAYVGRILTADTVDITPTDSSTVRSDLVIARIEDPWLDGEPWPDPTDPTVGPYIFTRVIENVPNTTVSVTELALGYSAIPLARIDLPVSTTAVTDAMITDLRTVANPRTARVIAKLYPGAATDASAGTLTTWLTLPNNLAVPTWATRARIRVDIVRATATTATFTGQIRANINAGSVTTDSVDVVEAAAARFSYNLVDDVAIPAGIRGTNVPVTIDAVRTSGTGVLEADTATSVFVDIEFVEVAE